MTQMNPELLELIVPHLARWLCYSFLLWFLIKIQRIQYSFLGLLAASAAAELTTLVPMVGDYLSYVVLLVCLWKVTRAKLAPDILFTVAVSSALMFCVNLWAIGALMGQLGFHNAEAEEPLVAEAAELPGPIEAEETAVPPVPEPPEPVIQPFTKEHPTGLAIKGIGFSSRRPLAMLSFGGQVMTKGPGEGFTFAGPEGTIAVRILEVHRSYALLELNGDQQIELHME